MRTRSFTVVAMLLLTACAGAPRSRWDTNENAKAGEHTYMVCKCDGTERQPTPSEAASFSGGERVDLYCEGKVHDCHRGDPHGNSPGGANARNQLD
jgi:hypothetical protein